MFFGRKDLFLFFYALRDIILLDRDYCTFYLFSSILTSTSLSSLLYPLILLEGIFVVLFTFFIDFVFLFSYYVYILFKH